MKNIKRPYNYRQNLSKNIALALLAMTIFTFSGNAQNGDGFGLKAGLNYNANGDYFESAGANAKHPDRNVGFHVGLYGKIGNRIYFKPEVVYTQTKSDYNKDALKIQKIDVPLLLGVKIFGPVSVFAGPSVQYILSSKFKDTTLKNLEDEFTVGGNFGIALNFNGFGVDLRYEKGLSKNFANLGIPENRIDTRPDQLILGLSLAL